eukprot:6468408-Amphidinium_carterae.1
MQPPPADGDSTNMARESVLVGISTQPNDEEAHSAKQPLPVHQRPSATPFIHASFSSTSSTTSTPTSSSADEDSPHIHDVHRCQPYSFMDHPVQASQSSPSGSSQHQFVTPPPTPDASQSPPPPELSRPPCNKGRQCHWAAHHELPQQGKVASLVHQYDRPPPAAVQQLGSIPSIPPEDMPPEITGSAESESSEACAKNESLPTTGSAIDETKVPQPQDIVGNAEDVVHHNPPHHNIQPTKQLQPRTSTPPRYGDAAYKQSHKPDTMPVLGTDRLKPKQVLPVLDLQETSPQLTAMPQQPKLQRQFFAIEIKSVAYLEQLRAARREVSPSINHVEVGHTQPEPLQSMPLWGTAQAHPPAVTEIPPANGGKLLPTPSQHQQSASIIPAEGDQLPVPLPSQARQQHQQTASITPAEGDQLPVHPSSSARPGTEPPKVSGGQLPTEPPAKQEPVQSDRVQDAQRPDIARVTPVLLPSVVVVPPPAHSPRIALQEPFNDPDRTRKLLAMAQSALCPPLQPDHFATRRQECAPIGTDPKLQPH